MTRTLALEILKKPVFGDETCIYAREFLSDECEGLRKQLLGKFMPCLVCNGRSDKCDVCNAEGTIKIDEKCTDRWDLDVLQQVAEELGLI